MTSEITPDVSALAINVTIPEGFRWTDIRRGEEFMLTTLNVRLLPDGHLAAKAYGRPTGGRPRHVRVVSRSRPARVGRAGRESSQPRRRAVGRAPRSALTVRCLTSSPREVVASGHPGRRHRAAGQELSGMTAAQTVLVTGATGRVGGQVVAQLAGARDVRVRARSRDPV